MENTNNQKIALITGGNRGLGKDMAYAISDAGTHVVITYRNGTDQANEVVADIRKKGVQAAALQLDVADSSSFAAFKASLETVLKDELDARQIDFLVNNAGIGHHATFAETTEEAFDNLMNTHLKGGFFLTQTLLPMLNDGGSIVNISTGLARFSLPGYGAYAAMKGGLETLTKYQAKELGARGIRVNIVAPGAIETDFGGGVVRDNKEVNGFIASQTTLGRVGLPEDIGGVVAFLTSDASRWITGQRLEVSGGMFL